MTQPRTSDLANAQEPKLPRRDWVLLPLLGLLTVCLLVLLNQLIIWRMFPYSKTVGEDCLVLGDPSARTRGIPNCVVDEKVAEGGTVEYRFNSDGYRNDFEFRAKSPDTYRIVMLGSSLAAGFRVREDQTIAALLPVELSRRTRRKVELYNESLPGRIPRNTALLFNEALRAKPDMVLWIVTPFDIQKALLEAPPAHGPKPPSPVPGAWHRLKVAFGMNSFEASISRIFGHPHSLLLLRHMLYESPSEYVRVALMAGDDEVGFLRSEPSVEWQRRLHEFDRNAAEIGRQASAAGVPYAVVLVPDRAQVAMISTGEWPAGFDPYKLDEELHDIITSHGGIYIDILPSFRSVPTPEQGYFPVDVHPNASGHAIIAGMLAKQLTSEIVQAPDFAQRPQATLLQGR